MKSLFLLALLCACGQYQTAHLSEDKNPSVSGNEIAHHRMVVLIGPARLKKFADSENAAEAKTLVQDLTATLKALSHEKTMDKVTNNSRSLRQSCYALQKSEEDLKKLSAIFESEKVVPFDDVKKLAELIYQRSVED